MALKAIKGIQTTQQLAQNFDAYQVQVSEWKKAMIEGATELVKESSQA